MSNTELKFSRSEYQSGLSRVKWAENLILQLPKDHDGRNSWLINYGVQDEARGLRNQRGIGWVRETESAAPAEKDAKP